MNREFLDKKLAELGFIIDDKTSENLEDLLRKTLETNEKFNLTAITDEEAFREKMIYDSALASVGLKISGKKAIDVGTGAGFPGMVIYLLDRDIKMTLLDSTAKKINYLKEYSSLRGYQLDFAIDRAEDYARKHVEQFDYAFARGVSSLNILLEIIVPLLRVGGYFVALKGANAKGEIVEATSALKKMNCHVEKIMSYTLPESGEERNILLIKKDSNNSKKYPRPFAEIKRRPL